MSTYEPINFKAQRRYYSFVPVVVALLAWIFLMIIHFQTKSFEVSPEVLQAVAAYDQRERVFELPVQLRIPSIDIDAQIQSVGLAEDGSGQMGIPSNFTDVGWYSLGVRPGMSGNAVIAGHYNGKRVKEAVFFKLETLRMGDEIVVVGAQGEEVIFEVMRVEQFDYNEATDEVFLSDDGKARLVLITCGGEWLPKERVYDERTVVFAEARVKL